MKPMKEALAAADRQTLIADVVKLIDSEVKSKSGLSGLALKSGYKVIKKLKNGRMISSAVNNLLDEFTNAIAPLHDEFRDSSETSFANFLNSNSARATDALLSITDERARIADHKVLRSTYNKLRGQAVKHVKDALPGLGHLIDSYTS